MEAGEPSSPQHSPALLCVCSHKIVHVATEHSACPEVAEASWARAEVAYGVAEGRAVAEAGLWASPGICSNHYRLLHCGTGIWASSAQSRDTNTGVWAPFMCPDALADP